MNKDSHSAKVFSRRAFVIGVLQAGFLTVLGGRLAWLQVVQGQRYKMLSDKNRINIKMIAPSRGKILDRFGQALAVNNQNFRVLVVPEQTDDLEKSLRGLQKFINLEEARIKSVVDRSRETAKFVPLEIRDDLSWTDVAKIEVNLPDLPGLSIDVGDVRSYPLNEASAHIVGYVGLPGKSEMTGDPVLSLPGFKIGKTGIEKKFDRNMRGRPGSAEVEVNVSGREVRELQRKSSTRGMDIMTSIDADLQQFAQGRLGQEKSASAVIMDAHTGAIYALASHPAFNPNMFTHGISAEQWEDLLASPGYPLTNKAIAGQYPPASTFKMVSALAGLEAGKITGERRVFCPGHYDYGESRFHCWKHGGHGSVNLKQALAQSCDTYFYEISTEIGIERIASMARALGLGQKYGFDLAEERPGLVPDKNWKMGYHGDIWRPGETIIASIGQGSLQATPLQLAVMTARLVNGGYAVEPWITGYVGSSAVFPKAWPKMDFHEWHLTLIKKGMDRAVNHETGTAFGSRIEIPGRTMGGKTGTAQVKKITQKQREEGIRNEDLPWKQRHHGLFVGYAPVKKPKYVCAVIVEHGVGGSVSAAPLARDLLVRTQERNPASSSIRLAKVG